MSGSSPGATAVCGEDAGPSAPVLRGEDLIVRYGGEPVLEVDEVELRDGELLVVLGPNGAGKSTLMRVLALLEAPAAGRVLYRGASGRIAAERLRDVSTAVFQRPHLWAGTVEDNLRLGLELSGVSGDAAEARLAATAADLGLETLLARSVDELSAGQAQRVALARALAPGPAVLFLDEPTANLDAAARKRLRRDVERFARRGGRSTLLVTHDRREAFRLADRIVVLDGGRRVRTGAPRELYERPGSRYVAEVSGAELALAARVDAVLDEEHGGELGEDGDGAGEVDSSGTLLRVEVDGVRLLAVGRARPGDDVAVTYRPEDLALAPVPGEGSGRRDRPAGGGGPGPDSVRNAFGATVEELREVRGLVRVRVSGPPDVVAVVTRGSAEALGLRPGGRVRVRVKAAALHVFPR